MTQRIFSSVEIETALRALVRTLAPTGPLAHGAARLVAAVQTYLGSTYDVGLLRPIDEVLLAERLVDPWLRQQLVRALIVGILIDGECTGFELARVEAIAAALGVEEPGLRDAALWVAGKRWRLRRHLLARFWVVDHVKARIAERGWFRTMFATVYATLFRRYRNPALAARYATLRDLPAGTLGRGFLDYLERNHFPLPGERGAVSDIIVAHDLAHVLGDYTTAPEEEVQVVTFSAGHRVKDPFALVLFALFQFHLGFRLTPGAKAERGKFDPALVIAAIARGAAVTSDLTAVGWDYWSELALPIEQVRAKHGIAPCYAVARRRLAS